MNSPSPIAPPTPVQSLPTPAAGLENLRDIHLPAPIDWWPPAPGWWILAALVLTSVVALSIWLRRRAQQRRYRKAALQKLQILYRNWQHQGDDIAFAQETNRLLKQTALAAFSNAEVASLNGAEWLDFLDRHLRKPRFTEPEVRAFATLYLREPEPIAADALNDAAKYWIRSHRC